MMPTPSGTESLGSWRAASSATACQSDACESKAEQSERTWLGHGGRRSHDVMIRRAVVLIVGVDEARGQAVISSVVYGS